MPWRKPPKGILNYTCGSERDAFTSSEQSMRIQKKRRELLKSFSDKEKEMIEKLEMRAVSATTKRSQHPPELALLRWAIRKYQRGEVLT